MIASDHESFIVDLNNKINNNNSPKLNFNSDKNINQSSESKKRYSSRLSNRDRSKSSSLNIKTNTLNNNIRMSLNSISSDMILPPKINNINLSPKANTINNAKDIGNVAKSNTNNSNINNSNVNNENINTNTNTNTNINPEPDINSIAYQKALKFKKMEVFAKLMHIKSMGIELTKKYTIECELDEMEAELKYHTDIQTKKNGVNLAKSFMCNAITGIEFLNEKYDPFGFKLKGWSDQVKINKDDFDEVFGELLQKYKGNGKKLEPELKLVMMLMISAGTFHMSQSMTNALPGLDDVIKNNPQLMSKLQSNINKKISGPSEFDKKKQLYENVKKLHEEKVQNKINTNNNTNINTNTNTNINTNTNTNKSINNKPISVKNLLQDIKSSLPANSNVDSNSITMGDTIYSDSESGVDKHTISNNVKTKSRLVNRKNIQFTNT